ncbi:hypothetical protein BUE93_08495 [Chromobacterium amazonense]|uniref:Type III secretion apparatus protein OrgA/MxiK n=1 Tax=Chromobacterium amazonense TaxID=1382803 RepID=A0A2S9X5Z5_9NEIS|nr:hypothetical protein BUE93_08495 [Chromobacterium amazonense]
MTYPFSLLHVLFDPLSYLHPRRLSLPVALTASQQSRAAANELLLAAYQLSSDCGSLEMDAVTRQWLLHWRRLPQIAYLIGCHSLRANLTWRGGLLTLPEWAYTFITIDLPTDPAPAQPIFSHDMLLSAGYARLQAGRKRLPLPLAQRLPLLFPPHVDTVEATTGADPLIFALALQHAQRYSAAPPSDTH